MLRLVVQLACDGDPEALSERLTIVPKMNCRFSFSVASDFLPFFSVGSFFPLSSFTPAWVPLVKRDPSKRAPFGLSFRLGFSPLFLSSRAPLWFSKHVILLGRSWLGCFKKGLLRLAEYSHIFQAIQASRMFSGVIWRWWPRFFIRFSLMKTVFKVVELRHKLVHSQS